MRAGKNHALTDADSREALLHVMPISSPGTNASIQPQSLAERTGRFGWRAMLTEVNLSPKPGHGRPTKTAARTRYGAGGFSPQRAEAAIRHWLPRFV